MRQIKFRFYSEHKDTGKISVTERTLDDLENEDSWQGSTPWKRIATCEFTGLKDKNGVEIYEGDIVKFKDYDHNWNGDLKHTPDVGTATVEFGHTAQHEAEGYTLGWQLNVIEMTNGHGFFFGIEVKEIEVIGNIYENGDLLK